MSVASASGASTRAEAPQPRIQLRSAMSLQTSSVSRTPPSGVSRSVCDGCHTRARMYGVTRLSNAISTWEGGPGQLHFRVEELHGLERAEFLVGVALVEEHHLLLVAQVAGVEGDVGGDLPQ